MCGTVPAFDGDALRHVHTVTLRGLSSSIERSSVMAFTPFTKKDAPAAGSAGAKEAPPNDPGKPAQGDPASPAGHPDQAAHTKDMPGGSADHAGMHKQAADAAATHNPAAK